MVCPLLSAADLCPTIYHSEPRIEKLVTALSPHQKNLLLNRLSKQAGVVDSYSRLEKLAQELWKSDCSYFEWTQVLDNMSYLKEERTEDFFWKLIAYLPTEKSLSLAEWKKQFQNKFFDAVKYGISPHESIMQARAEHGDSQALIPSSVLHLINETDMPTYLRLKLTDYFAVPYDFPKDANGNLSPMHQTIIWETEKNSAAYQRTSFPIQVSVKSVPKELVVINTLGGQNKVPDWLKPQFIDDQGHVLFPIHPLNQSLLVPFQNLPTTYYWTGHFTASRSMYFLDKQALSIKLPTDQPNPNQWHPGKANMKNSVLISLNRARLVEKLEKLYGEDPRLIVLREVMSIYDPITGNGFTVRDIRRLLDGHLYMPLSALDIEGARIAERHGKPVRDFWFETVAKAFGQTHALLLLRYGLCMKFPHLQNQLKQLASDFQPTETDVVRDMSDTTLVEPIARIIAPEFLQQDRDMNYKVETLATSFAAGYAAELSELLGVDGSVILKAAKDSYMKTIEDELRVGKIAGSLTDYLKSSAGQKALQAYYQRLAQEQKSRSQSPIAEAN